jgi:hypothetical protein
MTYSRSFLSNIILYYLFHNEELVLPNARIVKFNMYDNLEDYFMWAERRIDTLLCECANGDWSPTEQIRKIDQGLLRACPFLSRLIDRSYCIERFTATLEAFCVADTPPNSPRAEPAPVPSPPSPLEIAPEPAPVPSPPAPLEVEPEEQRPELPLARPEVVAAAAREPISLTQSVYKLRRAAADVGIKNAYLLTKSQVQQRLREYNDSLS